MQKISFKTEDGIIIYGNYLQGGEISILLLHMMPAVKESWDKFAEELNKIGLSVLAIDERGHGESVEGGKLDYKNFTNEEQQKKILDIKAAHKWLKGQATELSAIAGASIGANLALQYQVESNLNVKTLLFSAGFNYKGIETKPLVKKLRDPQGVFFIGAKGDIRGDGNSCALIAEELFKQAKINNKKLFISETEKHGTDLLEVEPGLMPQALEWIKI